MKKKVLMILCAVSLVLSITATTCAAANYVSEDTKASGFANGFSGEATLGAGFGVYGGLLTLSNGNAWEGTGIVNAEYNAGVIDYDLKIRNSLAGGGSIDYYLFIEDYVGGVSIVSGSEYGTIEVLHGVPSALVNAQYASVYYVTGYTQLNRIGTVSELLPSGTYVHIASTVSNTPSDAPVSLRVRVSYISDILDEASALFSYTLDFGSVLTSWMLANSLTLIPLVMFIIVFVVGVIVSVVKKK